MSKISEFLLKIIPYGGSEKNNNIPGVNWLKHITAEFLSIQQFWLQLGIVL